MTIHERKTMATSIQQSKPKKVKVGTILHEETLQRLKELAAREGRPISEVIEEAVRKYERGEALERELRLKAFEQFRSIRFNISDEDFKAIMEEDYYDQ